MSSFNPLEVVDRSSETQLQMGGNINCPILRLKDEIFQFERCIFVMNRNIFNNLKLEIASAIPASNDEKYLRISQPDNE